LLAVNEPRKPVTFKTWKESPPLGFEVRLHVPVKAEKVVVDAADVGLHGGLGKHAPNDVVNHHQLYQVPARDLTDNERASQRANDDERRRRRRRL